MHSLIAFALLASAAGAVRGEDLVLEVQALDPLGIAVNGISFTYSGTESPTTTDSGMTVLRVPLKSGQTLPAGTALEIGLPASLGRTWFLIDDTVHVPSPGQPPAEVVVMKRTDLRRLADDVQQARVSRLSEELSPEDKQQVLIECAQGYGLSTAELEAAIQAFRETAENPMDAGIGLFLEQEYAAAEPFFRAELEKREMDVVEPARYLGLTLLEQGKYGEAAESLRKAAAIRNKNTVLLALLGEALVRSGQWLEAEIVFRRALSIDEASYGAEHLIVARDLRSLAELFLRTSRIAEAEHLMRGALAIDESRYGQEDPIVARDLNNLALLLNAADRHAEAEPLIRRALAIFEARYGPDHPTVAHSLNNLALLFKDTKRFVEAELVVRRALKIDETKLGPDHPRVARDLNNLALLYKDTNRLTEANDLMRRAIAIDETSYGPDHPNVATRLRNLAVLLEHADRRAEAESLVRRALAIDVASYGPDQSNVALDLYHLALLLEAMNRMAEAEPPLRRAVAILEASFVPNHPWRQEARSHLEALLANLGQASKNGGSCEPKRPKKTLAPTPE